MGAETGIGGKVEPRVSAAVAMHPGRRGDSLNPNSILKLRVANAGSGMELVFWGHCLVLSPSLSPSTRDFTAMPCSFLKTRVCLLTDSTTVVPHAVPRTHTVPYTPRPPLVARALFSDLPLETHCGLGLFCCPHVP